MALTLFNTMTAADRSAAIKKLIEQSSPRQDFFMMVTLAILMATFGLLTNSMPVIIGSMLIAPLLYPVLGLALGIVIADYTLVFRSTITVFKSSLIGILAAAAVTLAYAGQDVTISSLVWLGDRTEVVSLMVAVIAGTAASFALVKPKLSETLPGIAISVSLIPPLATVGVGLAWRHWDLMLNALMIFLINVGGIIAASVIVFTLMHLHQQKKAVVSAVKEDDIEIKKEEKVAEDSNS